MRVVTACAFALTLHAASAFAAEAEHGAAHGSGEGWWLLARHALNLAILAFVLVRFALPALREFMRQRAEQLREQIDSARRDLELAQRELRQLRAELSRADEEERDLVADAERAAQAEQERLLARSRETADRLRDDARRIADQELERARGVLRAEAAELATQLAADLLRERLDASDDRRLFDEFAERAGNAS
jgi:F-type H+-transporting ATPase subunit b